MQPSNSKDRNAAYLGQLLYLGMGLALVYFIYTAAYSYHTYSSTGLLYLQSSDPNAALVVSQQKTQPKSVGTGNAKLRLSPGKYQVTATDKGYQTTATVSVYKKKSSSSYLQLVTSELPSNVSGLLPKLPVIGPASEYYISVSSQSSNNSSSSVIIINAATPSDRQGALNWIRQQGYNPSYYKIEFQSSAVQNYHYAEGPPS